MINAYLNNNIGFSVAAGDTYGPELHTDANAASDPNGNEADAITGWSQLYLNGTGSNVFESQGSVKNEGSFSFHAESNDTPSAGASIFKSFTTEIGATYKLDFDWRHVGTGGTWSYKIAATWSGDLVSNTDIVFASVSTTFVAVGVATVITFGEYGVSNDGGIYLDNFSIRKVL